MKQIFVAFINKKLKENFELLEDGKFEDKQLYDYIDRAMDDLKRDPSCGTKIPKRLWPKIYVRKYGITNLWKYDLPNGWRVIYTIEVDKIKVVNIILEWFDHKEYNRRFNY